MPFKNPEARRAHLKDYGPKWYAKNRDKHLSAKVKSQRARVSERQRLVNEMKTKPCTDCHRTFDPVCMDFDHVHPGTKVRGVGQMLAMHSWDSVLQEIAKCELVCSNCHRIRTRDRGYKNQHNKNMSCSGLQDRLQSGPVPDRHGELMPTAGRIGFQSVS